MTEAASLRILIVEDDPTSQMVASRMLDRLGHRSDVVGDGREALEVVTTATYDVVLMDLKMPHVDGLEATRRLRAWYGDRPRPRIVALTARAMKGDRERCLEAGMDDYLAKPLHLEDLMAALSACTPRRAARPEVSLTVIDGATLRELETMLGEDPGFFRGLLQEFLEDAERLVATIRTASEEGTFEELQRAAHTLKSSSATFGALSFSALCRELEEDGHAGGPEGLASKVEQLEMLFAQVRHELQARVEPA